MRSPKLLALFASSLLAVGLTTTGCDDGTADQDDAGVHRDGGSGEDDAGQIDIDSDAGQNGHSDAGTGRDAGLNPDAACVATEAEATLVKKPIDIIFLVDNSGSMSDEIMAVQENINVNFASIIGASEIDYRVILVSAQGDAADDDSICIEAPLSSLASCEPAPYEPGNNPPIFFHYDLEIASHDSLCKLIDAFDSPDTHDFAPSGWSQWLRAGSHKVFVELSDDSVRCPYSSPLFDDGDSSGAGTPEAAAREFDEALTALSPEQFGTTSARNYTWHSIVNVAAKSNPTQAYAPNEPIQTTRCNATSAEETAGTGYQALSRLTGGLRFPICERGSYDAVFRAIAQGVIEGAVVDCEYPVPTPPPGREIDLRTVVIAYTPGNGGAQQRFRQVADAAHCEPGAFYVEQQTTLKLCPATCSTVQADSGARLSILYGCAVELQ